MAASFPPTHRTWIDRQLDGGDPARAALREHVMAVYAGPLQAYLSHTRYRSCGDPTELVHGFFADRLVRDDYLVRWRASGLRLRRWLANGLLLYAKESRRRNRRDSRARAVDPDLYSTADTELSPEAAMDRAFTRSVVRRAMEQAARDCREQGLEQHWRMFIGHTYEDTPYRDLGAAAGVSPERAAVMARTASRRLRTAVSQTLELDGVPPDRLRSAIHELLERAS
ncbi:MAG: hypothetical protein KDC98_15965 [Planctomycetes bacterium]|nr:hypothetical protein [Planctomycetota bacterium]